MNTWQRFLGFVDSVLEYALIFLAIWAVGALLMALLHVAYKALVFIKNKHDAWFNKKTKEMAKARLAAMSEEEKEVLRHQIIVEEWKETQFKPALRKKKQELREKLQLIEKLEKY